MVNDLQCDLPSVKYVDDTTIYEVLKAGELSKMQEAANSCHQWAIKNKMQINTTKTKEILIDFTKKKRDLPPLSINNTQIERVSSQKLLGIQISHDLSWKEHVNQIVCKASKRIYQIVMLKRANVQIDDLVRIYTTIIRPILEYACQVWHTRLTIEQSYQIEQVQKRVLRIFFHNIPYEEALKLSGLLTLKERREYMCKKLFEQMKSPKHKLNCLLPPIRNNEYNTRSKRKFDIIKTRTKRFSDSFVPFYVNTNF